LCSEEIMALGDDLHELRIDEKAGRGGHRKNNVMQDSFFNSPKSWSKRKHRLLGKYLPPFSAKVGSWAKLIYCIDGFAGAAKYEDGSAGSPLMMAQLSDKCANWHNPVHLKLINVEADPDNYLSLVNITGSWEDKGIVENLPGAFGSHIPEIINKIGNAPAFFFIDPYGPTYVRFADLLSILTREQRATELIINFDADGLRRIADTMRTKAQTLKTIKAVKTNLGNVADIVGSNEWEERFAKQSLSTNEREEILLREYLKNLASYDYFVAAYAIRKAKGQHPKYFIVFCTRHPAGIVLMNSFIREEEDELLKESSKPSNQLLFPTMDVDVLSDEINQRREKLGGLLKYYLENHRETTRGQIKKHFIFEQFGVFHDKDYNAVIKELIHAGKLLPRHGRKQINDNEPLTYAP